MIRYIRSLKTPSVRNSGVYYLGSLIGNFGGYLFHLILLRLLTPAIYGEFLTYVSFLYLLAIPSGTISVFVTKYIANRHGKNNVLAINNFFYLILGKIIAPLTTIGILVIIFAPSLSVLFKANPSAFIVLGLNVVISLLSSVIRSYVLAFQHYFFNTAVVVSETLIKIILAYFFIMLGYGATGGVLALLITSLTSLVICFLKIKPALIPKLSKKTKTKIKLRRIFTNSFIYSAGFLSLMSTDVILVRLYFDTHTSGLYSGLSMLGRMIFYGTTPLAGFLLPFVANRYAKKQKTKIVFLKLGIVTTILGVIGLSIFTLIPEKIIIIISGSNYLENIPLLPKFSLTMFFFSINYFILTYLISINRSQANWILLIGTLLQVILIQIFHQTISQIININLIIQIYLLISLILFYKIKTNDVR